MSTKPDFDLFKGLMSLLMSLLTASVLYGASTLVKLQITSAEQARDLSSLSTNLLQLKQDNQIALGNRYTSDQAASDWRLQESRDVAQDAKIDRTVEWNQRLSDRLADVEKYIRNQGG